MFSAWVVDLIIFGGAAGMFLLAYATMRIYIREGLRSQSFKPTEGSKAGSTVGDQNNGRGGHDSL